MNKVFLIGNLTRDPELKYAKSGSAIAALGLAVNHSYVTDGEKREEVNFFDVTVFGKQAEAASQYLKKGRPVLIDGRLKYETWDDKQGGGKRSKIGVIAERVQFLGGNKDAQEPAAKNNDEIPE